MKKLFFILSICFLFSTSCTNESVTSKEQKEEESVSDNKTFFESQLTYKIIKERNDSPRFENDSLEKVMGSWLTENENAKLNDLVDFALDMTINQLSFTFNKCSSNPNDLVKTGKANCIGYSSFFNSMMNYLLIKKQLNKRYECIHYVGKIYYAGQNINALFNDPFFKDHDFNMIKDIENKNTIIVDPSLYEYLGVKRIRLHH